MTKKLIEIASFRNHYVFGKKLPIDLSLSENPLGCSAKVLQIIKKLDKSDFFDYPDPDCFLLSQVIAKKFNLKTANLFFANGSEAIIKLISQILLSAGEEVIIPRLTFPIFRIASQIAGGKVRLSEMTPALDINLTDIRLKITRDTKLIFLCNPNNPTGKVIPKKEIINFVKTTTKIVVVDEANIEFGGETMIGEVNKFANLIVLRTFSKGFGLAGLRIGFCAANPKFIQQIKQQSQPFPVSKIAEKAALAAFLDKKFIQKTRRFMDKERNFLTQELSKRGLDVINSQANNLIVKVPMFSTNFVKLLNRQGVSVVDGAAFDFKDFNFIRVSPRLRKINLIFLQAVDQILICR